jgi:hypothetical protein
MATLLAVNAYVKEQTDEYLELSLHATVVDIAFLPGCAHYAASMPPGLAGISIQYKQLNAEEPNSALVLLCYPAHNKEFLPADSYF